MHVSYSETIIVKRLLGFFLNELQYKHGLTTRVFS